MHLIYQKMKKCNVFLEMRCMWTNEKIKMRRTGNTNFFSSKIEYECMDMDNDDIEKRNEQKFLNRNARTESVTLIRFNQL